MHSYVFYKWLPVSHKYNLIFLITFLDHFLGLGILNEIRWAFLSLYVKSGHLFCCI